MIRLYLRLKRGFILAWSLPMLALLAVMGPAFESYYPDLDSRYWLIESMNTNVATRAIYGMIEQPGTIGQFIAWEVGAWLVLLGSVMAVMLQMGLARRPEDTGTGELVRSTGVSLLAPQVAALAVTTLASLFVGLGSWAVLLVQSTFIDELTGSGAVAFGAVITVSMIGSAVVASLISLLIDDPHLTTRTGLYTVGVGFLLRAFADVREISWLGALTPLGWRQLIRPFTDDDWGRLALFALAIVVVAGLWLAGESRREYGRALWRFGKSWRGRTRNTAGPLRMQWVLARPIIAVWVVWLSIYTVFMSYLSTEMTDLISTSEGTAQILVDMLPSTDDMQASFFLLIAQLGGILLSVAVISRILAHRAEEVAGLVDISVASGRSRWRPLATHTLLGVATLVIGVAAMSLFGALTAWRFASDGPLGAEQAAYAFTGQLAPVVLLGGFAVFMAGVLPRLSALVWAPVAYSAVVLLFGEIMQLPDWAIDVSVFTHVIMPGDDNPVWPLIAMAGGGVLLSVGGLWRMQRREVLA